ncbi:MAG: hypothetical protein ACLP52_04830 [Streptosporangiaceae bacterium]
MTEPSELAALLLQLTDLSGKLAALDQRQAGDTSEIRARLAALAALAEALKGTIADQAKILASLAGIDETVAALADRLADSGPAGAGGGYKPAPAPRFWKLTGPDREQAISRLRSWADQIYRPGYGSLAAGLAPCWQNHPLCLYGLDWLSELWSLLYLRGDRTPAVLAGQAEWQTRLMPAIADQMNRETRTCRDGHRDPAESPASRALWASANSAVTAPNGKAGAGGQQP